MNDAVLYDLTDDDQVEKSVTGGGSFSLSSDGKKLLLLRGSAPQSIFRFFF